MISSAQSGSRTSPRGMNPDMTGLMSITGVPSMASSPLTRSTRPSTPTIRQMVPLGRPGTPDDIAQGILTLLSEERSAYITGEILNIDGGIALHNWITPPETL